LAKIPYLEKYKKLTIKLQQQVIVSLTMFFNGVSFLITLTVIFVAIWLPFVYMWSTVITVFLLVPQFIRLIYKNKIKIEII
jgi:hypothetical protein